jgi:hypothetical protein
MIVITHFFTAAAAFLFTCSRSAIVVINARSNHDARHTSAATIHSTSSMSFKIIVIGDGGHKKGSWEQDPLVVTSLTD